MLRSHFVYVVIIVYHPDPSTFLSLAEHPDRVVADILIVCTGGNSSACSIVTIQVPRGKILHKWNLTIWLRPRDVNFSTTLKPLP